MGLTADRAPARRRQPRRVPWWALPAAGLSAVVAVIVLAMTMGGLSLRPAASSARAAGQLRPVRLDAGGNGPTTGDGPAAAGAASAGSSDCTLIVPAGPLTAAGLATPYQLTATNAADGPCHESNAGQAAFVQAAILDPATGKISVYNPLVVDAGTAPAVAPDPPSLPPDAIVAVWFGFNGDVLTLQAPGTTLAGSHCVNGTDPGPSLSPFGQMAYCNAHRFFRFANRAVRRHLLAVPRPGTGADGLPCLTTRSFGLVDQDQSDNVTAQYLITSQGQLAQDTAANRQQLAGATVLSNGSDNGLLTFIMDPALGCSPWLAPDLADGGALAPALPLNELQAAVYAGRRGTGPAALVPANDPMTTVQGAPSTAKTDAYRAGVDQPRLPAGQSAAGYCRALGRLQGRRLQQDVNLLIGRPSPMAGAASNLFTFLASRLQQSFVNLGCAHFGLVNNVTITADQGGMAVAACFRQQVAPVTPGAGNPTAGRAVCPATTAAPMPAASMPSSTAPSATPAATVTAPTPTATATSAPALAPTPAVTTSAPPAAASAPASRAPASSRPGPGSGPPAA